MSFESSLALLFMGLWIAIVAGWGLSYLWDRYYNRNKP